MIHVTCWQHRQRCQHSSIATLTPKNKVSEPCQDNPYGFNGVVVFGDETYGLTQGCMLDMTGYNQYLTRIGNGFRSGVINADSWNDAQASRQMLPVNVAVTVSAISAPMDTRIQLGGRHLDPPFTEGYALQPVYGWGGNGSQLWDRCEQHGEEERNVHLKEKKKKSWKQEEEKIPPFWSLEGLKI